MCLCFIFYLLGNWFGQWEWKFSVGMKNHENLLGIRQNHEKLYFGCIRPSCSHLNKNAENKRNCYLFVGLILQNNSPVFAGNCFEKITRHFLWPIITIKCDLKQNFSIFKSQRGTKFLYGLNSSCRYLSIVFTFVHAMTGQF